LLLAIQCCFQIYCHSLQTDKQNCAMMINHNNMQGKGRTDFELKFETKEKCILSMCPLKIDI